MLDLNLLLGFDLINSLTKIFFLGINFMAIIFFIVVFKQVLSMDNLVHEADDSFILKLIAFMLIVVSVSLFFAALVIL